MSFIAQSYALLKINSHANASICLKKTASLANAMHHIEQGAMTQCGLSHDLQFNMKTY
jgi:hypothetical protein